MTPHKQAPEGEPRGPECSDVATTPNASKVAPVTVTAVAVTPRHATRDVLVLCPFCGRQHHHGWPYDSEGEPGARLSHCGPYRTRGGRRIVPERGSYYIVVDVAS